MTEERIRIICSGRVVVRNADGSTSRIQKHGEMAFPDLIASDGAISEVRTRQAPTKLTGRVEATVDDETVTGHLHSKTVVQADGHRGTNGTWRWRCPGCGLDKPMREDALRRWIAATPSRVLDLSLLAR